jgi:hypothetical protein
LLLIKLKIETMKKINSIVLAASIIITSQTWAQLQVQPSGNVGVGTQTPNYRLQVLCNTTGTDGILVSNNQTPSFAAFIRGNASNSTASTPDYTWYGDNTTGFFHPAAWQVGVAIGGSEKFRFNWDGCFYINTTSNSDAEKLAVSNAGNAGYPVMTNNHISNGSYNYAQKFYIDNNNTKTLAIINGSTDKFYVLGTGDAWAHGSWLSSDRNLKENINPITRALDKVLKLQGVTYKFKDAGKGLSAADGFEMGLIAQDVEKVVPEVVATNDKGMKGIAYSNLVGLLVEAIKEQNKTIEDLKQQMQSCCQSSQTSENIPNTTASGLSQNIPNPFSENTEITYSLASGVQKGTMYVFDMQGTLLKTFDGLKAGTGKIQINGGDLKPGMYLYSLITDGKEVDTKRMILTRQ